MSKRKQSCLDSFFNKETVKEHDRADSVTVSEEYGSEDNAELVSRSNKTPNLKKYRPFKRKYDPEYLKYGFVSGGDETNPEPLCVICGATLSNDAMKPSKLIRHLRSLHPTYKDKPIDFFERKRHEIIKQQTQMVKSTVVNVCALKIYRFVNLYKVISTDITFKMYML